jgi:outer membrane protein insertion porin family
VLVDRSRTRIKALGYFKTVEIKPVQGSQPDKTVLNVTVQEQSTGELSLGAGYSSTSSFVGQFSYTQRNLFGRGQYLRASISASAISKEFQLSFTEPYFLDRPLAAGFDIYKIVTDYDQAGYQGDTTAAGIRFGFPTSEFGAVGLRYTFRIDKITLFSNASEALIESGAGGTADTSSIGYSYDYNTLDDPIRPTKGAAFDLSQDFAGFGGSLKYIRTESKFTTFRKVLRDEFVAKFAVRAGYIQAYGGQGVRLNERFFEGGDSFRGFALAGIGPRDVNAHGGESAFGGNAYAIGTLELRLPDFLPTDYGISTSLFSDFGTLGHLDHAVAVNCDNPLNKSLPCIKDNLAFRASGGLAIGWKSPFGPVEIDVGMPFIRESYDKSQIIRFSAGTGL